jgi:outer membrane protein assembly factor BamB
VAVIDPADGRLARRIELGSFLYGGALALPDGGFVVGLADGTVRALGAEGESRWSFRTVGAARRLGVRSTPALRPDGVIIIGAEDGGIYGLRATDGTLAFRVATSAPVRSRACVDRDGWAYVGGEDDQVHAIAPDDSEAWRVTVGADVDSGPRLIADGLLVVGADDGALHAIAGTP